jgi:ABC-type lipoprotein export system ATPase subunit
MFVKWILKMIEKNAILRTRLYILLEKYPFLNGYFSDNNFDISEHKGNTFGAFLNSLDEEYLEDNAISKSDSADQLFTYIKMMLEFIGEDQVEVFSLTIERGTDKDGNNEGYDKLKINRGDIVSIVGPTGSGKSRLLADIEWVAQCDTPTNRRIYINDEEPNKKWRFSVEDKLVAQLSQNMNFVMDLSVEEFIELHAESRMVEDVEGTIVKILKQANDLAGESFSADTPITSLSGGQSRALMIADTAILSKSPIVLIDEIENAGIDRKKALSLLLSEDKIVLIATHDPTLALLGNKRIVIQNGGISKIIETTDEERKVLVKLEIMDEKIRNMRDRLRYGKTLKI